MADLVRRTRLTTAQLEALAAAGAFDCFGLTRREALWLAGKAAQDRPEYLAGLVRRRAAAAVCRCRAELEEVAADLWATGHLSRRPSDPPRPRRARRARGALLGAAARPRRAGRRIEVGGVVTHRQRPATASGITFLNLEDETGLAQRDLLASGCGTATAGWPATRRR